MDEISVYILIALLLVWADDYFSSGWTLMRRPGYIRTLKALIGLLGPAVAIGRNYGTLAGVLGFGTTIGAYSLFWKEWSLSF